MDALIWVDPLDCTNDFVKENLPAVTVLIGLAISGFSRFGIVHNPFNVKDETRGENFFGSAEHGVFSINHSKEMKTDEILARKINYLQPFDHNEEPD